MSTSVFASCSALQLDISAEFSSTRPSGASAPEQNPSGFFATHHQWRPKWVRACGCLFLHDETITINHTHSKTCLHCRLLRLNHILSQIASLFCRPNERFATIVARTGAVPLETLESPGLSGYDGRFVSQAVVSNSFIGVRD